MRSVWILNLIPNDKAIFSTFGNEFDFLIRKFVDQQTIVYNCMDCSCEIAKKRGEFFLETMMITCI